MKNCKTCNGSGKAPYLVERDCRSCEGMGVFPEVDENAILERITARKGKNRGKLRASMVSPWGDKANLNERRSYYVWRLARFYSGVDSTMPIAADLVTHGDPYKENLDKLADIVAMENFGDNTSGIIKWGKALGMM